MKNWKIDTFHLKLWIMLAIISVLGSCKDGDQVNLKEPDIIANKTLENPIDSIEIVGDNYNDSMIAALVEAQLPKEAISFDEFEVLHTIACSSTLIDDYEFTMDSVFKFQETIDAGSEELRRLIHVSHCYSKYRSNDVYDAYIFFSDIIESHSSQSFMLISIQKENNTIDHLDLSIEYGDESGDYILSSTINKGNVIERRLNHNMRFIPGIGEVDSIFLERELYMINDLGQFEKLESRLEPSNVVNYLH